jgi:hypothetical protein
VNVTTERRSVEKLVIGLSPVQAAANLNFYTHYDAVLHTQHHRADRPGRAAHRVLIQKSQTAATGASFSLPHLPAKVSSLNAERPLGLGSANWPSCPICMDRLPFATDGVLSEVADMYPAC